MAKDKVTKYPRLLWQGVVPCDGPCSEPLDDFELQAIAHMLADGDEVRQGVGKNRRLLRLVRLVETEQTVFMEYAEKDHLGGRRWTPIQLTDDHDASAMLIWALRIALAQQGATS